MNQDQYCDMLFESFYDAVALCDEKLINTEGDLLFNFLVTDMIQNSSGKYLTFTDKTGTRELHTFLDAYQQRLQINANVAESIEAKLLSNISSYSFDTHMDFKSPELREKGYSVDFKPIKIKAVIDWLDLSFEVNPSRYSFAYKPHARSYIKSFLTMKTGKKHYVKHNESDINQDGLVFTVRLHDIRNKADLLKIAGLLDKQYGAEIPKMKIRNIELSLDVYNAQNNALLIALFKSLRLSMDTKNLRIYKNQKGTFRSVIQDPSLLLKYIDDDWCIGINHRDSPLFYRLYHKTTDRNKTLDKVEHRHRVEVNLNGLALENIDCHPYNLSSLIKYGFRKILFTLPSFESNSADKTEYENNVKPFGMETTIYSKTNHRTRALAPYLKSHTQLNRLIRKAVDNLSRKF